MFAILSIQSILKKCVFVKVRFVFQETLLKCTIITIKSSSLQFTRTYIAGEAVIERVIHRAGV